jgi:anti-sigma regulatory factor (Ser/Thr protein kinase)
MLNSFLSGSKNSSTTRSLSGMIAFSVMVMNSGQTWRQQVVMFVVADAMLVLQVLDPVFGVERMHLEMECGSRFEGRRRCGGLHLKCADRYTEELTVETQTPYSNSVRYFR